MFSGRRRASVSHENVPERPHPSSLRYDSQERVYSEEELAALEEVDTDNQFTSSSRRQPWLSHPSTSTRRPTVEEWPVMDRRLTIERSRASRRPSQTLWPTAPPGKSRLGRRPTFQEMMAFGPQRVIAPQHTSEKSSSQRDRRSSSFIAPQLSSGRYSSRPAPFIPAGYNKQRLFTNDSQEDFPRIPGDDSEEEIEPIPRKLKLSKLIYHIFNVFYMTSGIGLLIFGVVYIIKIKNADEITIFNIFDKPSRTPFLPMAFIFIAEGGIIICTAFGGYLANSNNSRPSMLCCLTFLFVVFIFDVALALNVLLYRQRVLLDTEQLFENSLSARLTQAYGYDKAITKGFDVAQINFRCCGVFGGDDYTKKSKFMIQNMTYTVPNSCCVRMKGDFNKVIDQTKCQSRDIFEHQRFRYQNGCLQPLEDWVVSQCIKFGNTSFMFALIQMFGMIANLSLLVDLENL